MKKHAYLIMAHNNFEILKSIISLLDSEKNDIYIHIDKKKEFSNNAQKSYKEIAQKSKIVFIQNRQDVRWGGYSQIATELELLKEATKSDYSYYHLISGVDMPLKSSEEIYNFFEKNAGKEFIHFRGKKLSEKELERISLYHFFQQKLKNKRKNIIFYFLEYMSLRIQKILKVNRIKNERDIVYMSGANWFSITNELAKYVIQKEEWIKRHFKYTKCADEIFMQTIVYNSKFKKNLYYDKMDDNYIACMRLIDWKRGKPYIWRFGDFQELVKSKYMFARKFDYNIDDKIVEEINNYIKGEKRQ